MGGIVFFFNLTCWKLNTIPLSHSNVPALGSSILVDGTIVHLVALVRNVSISWFFALFHSPYLIHHVVMLILTPKYISNQYHQIFPFGTTLQARRVSWLVFFPSNTLPSHYSPFVTKIMSLTSLRPFNGSLWAKKWPNSSSAWPGQCSPLSSHLPLPHWSLPSSYTGVLLLKHTMFYPPRPPPPPKEQLLHVLLASFSLECYLMNSLEKLSLTNQSTVCSLGTHFLAGKRCLTISLNEWMSYLIWDNGYAP